MKNWVIISILLLSCLASKSQLLSWSPAFIQESTSSVDIICDASKGNKGLYNYTPTSDVYVHIGAITTLSASQSDWKYVPYTWGTTNSNAQATYLGNNKWKFTISGGLRNFFGITSSNEKILRVAILFRNGNGNSVLRNADGTDMYVPVYDNNLYVRIDTPLKQPYYTPVAETITKNIGDNISINAKANQSSALKIYFNGTTIATASSATQLSATASITNPGTQTIIAESNNGSTTARDTVAFIVNGATNFAALPTGVTDGINYESGDTSVVLVLYAPKKNQIVVTGDFNNWSPTAKYQMNETPDSLRFWLRITGLTPGTEYAYQYIIDNSLTVADYNAEKILDKANDPYIPTTTYPNLKSYPTNASGNIVSVLQTAKPAYNWQVTNFTRPDKRNLLIYELWVGNFTAAQNYQAVKDTLSYLKRLGVNAIELMPINEFEGNVSWGYNPNFYFAPDKYYGTETALKQLIDACHQQGIAVIMDMVMNHSFGSSPMVQMYWDATNNIPAANNPWFSQYYTHAYNVGYQFNNASVATKQFRERVMAHWLKNYHVDGYRFDLAKGYTPTNTCDATGNNCNVNAWGALDQQRINIWDTLYTYQQSVSANSYCILEMFADNSEETIEASHGMMLWGNMNSNYGQATMSYTNPSWDLSYGIYTNRGWSQPNLITYQESHDEERIMNKNELYGNSSGSYNIKDTATGLKRNAMATAFWATIPGPKMLWQFGEVGYDYSINTCSNLSVNASCRLSQKPVRWDYYNNANRNALYNVYSKLFALRNNPSYIKTFTTGNITYNLSNAIKTLTVTSDSLDIVVVGNFDVVAQSGSIAFPVAGVWTSYLTGSSKTATGNTEPINLQPGEYYVYIYKPTTSSGTVTPPPTTIASDITVNIFPNPVQYSSTIQYSLPESGNVNINLFDISGKKVATVFSGYKTSGPQTVSVSKNIISNSVAVSGIYLLEIEINGKKKTTKIIIQ